MERNYCVYKHTTPSGKVYIGLTGNTPKERWDSGHGYRNNPHFWNAIKLYGWKNINHEILYTNLTKEEAGEIERQLIAEYDSKNPDNGYNQLEGGTFGYTFSHTEEAKHKISEAAKHLWESETHRLRMSAAQSGENNPFYGKHHTAEAREKLKKWHAEHPLSKDQIKIKVERMREANLGRKMNRSSVEKSARAKWKPINQYTKDGEFVKTWDSAKEACETLHINKSTVCQCCKGIKPSAGGYIWRYADTQETG